MDNEFYTLLTNRGMAKIASALADKKTTASAKDGRWRRRWAIL
ncbi:Uncharacterised protein [Escherichia coli]|uniref:Uncharacterized protein n=1 Tax=Escherichia coli TaxID=562 RepID=A0A376VSF1_ECOLX|nr:Uncharacterised protein [Escherichia coli]